MSRPRERQMRVIGAPFRLEPLAKAFPFDQSGELTHLLRAGPQAEPQYARQLSALEPIERPQLERETPRCRRLDVAGDALGRRELDMPEEPEGDVQVLSPRPPELRQGRAPSEQVIGQRLPVLLGQRQPEERADLGCAFYVFYALYARFAQCVGAQAPGRFGRQPN